MRQRWMLLVGVLLTVAVAGCSSARASNLAAAWIEVSPGSVPAGARVAIRASCVDNSVPASANAPFVGTVTLQPTAAYLQTELQVPPTTQAGKYTITLNCPNGSKATTSLTVTNEPPTPQPVVGPHTGGGFLANKP